MTKFYTDFIYTDRKTKAHYVYRKYNLLLTGKILDVGADECHLKQHLNENILHIGIGLGEKLDKQVDLEKEPIPFSNNSFDCVLCLDVLEHLENINEVFDELCRVTRKWVITSLPNPYAAFLNYLKQGNYNEQQHMKFYGLLLEKPEDRHKWFFSFKEAKSFIQYRAKKNHMEVIQIDSEDISPARFTKIKRLMFKYILRRYEFLLPLITDSNFHNGTLWAVLKKIPNVK